MPRKNSVVEWDGQPGRMPPRMGAWQPERLRYGAATKNQRVAERFPEGKHFGDGRCPSLTMAQRLAGAGGGELAIVHHNLAVDQYEVEALRVLMGLGVS